MSSVSSSTSLASLLSSPSIISASPSPSSPRKGKLKVPKFTGWSDVPISLSRYRLSQMKLDLSKMLFPKARRVFGVSKLCHHILIHCDIYTIILVSRVDRARCHAAQKAIRSLLKMTLYPYIHPNDFVSFINLMAATGLAIVGSIARGLMLCNSHLKIDALLTYSLRFVFTSNINLVVPCGMIEQVKWWFIDHGYSRFMCKVVYRAFRQSVTDLYQGSKKHGRRTISVTLSESVRNVMHVIAASPLTSWMNAMTSTRMYSFYPTLLTNRHALHTNILSVEYARPTGANFVTKAHNGDWTGKCGIHCPCLPRKTLYDTGIASFHWNDLLPVLPSRFPGCDSLLIDAIIYWRLTAKCHNQKCKHFVGKPLPL